MEKKNNGIIVLLLVVIVVLSGSLTYVWLYNKDAKLVNEAINNSNVNANDNNANVVNEYLPGSAKLKALMAQYGRTETGLNKAIGLTNGLGIVQNDEDLTKLYGSSESSRLVLSLVLMNVTSATPNGTGYLIEKKVVNDTLYKLFGNSVTGIQNGTEVWTSLYNALGIQGLRAFKYNASTGNVEVSEERIGGGTTTGYVMTKVDKTDINGSTLEVYERVAFVSINFNDEIALLSNSQQELGAVTYLGQDEDYNYKISGAEKFYGSFTEYKYTFVKENNEYHLQSVVKIK